MTINPYIDLKLKAVMLDVFDNKSELCAHATGFIVKEDGGYFLYTCWHVVTGIDPISLNFTEPPDRTSITVYSQAVIERVPGVTAIGGSHSILIDLYDDIENHATRRWLQSKREVENPDLNAIGLQVPSLHDVVKIPINADDLLLEKISLGQVDIVETNESMAQTTEKIIVAGYPYGYSSLGDEQPTPVILTRFVSSDCTPRWTEDFLIDGACAPGMSGSPLFVERKGKLVLIGIYIGEIYPDYTEGGLSKNDRFAALGRCCRLGILLNMQDSWG